MVNSYTSEVSAGIVQALRPAALKLAVAGCLLLSLAACKGRGDPQVLAEEARSYEIKVLFDRKGCPIGTKLQDAPNGRVNFPVVKAGRDSIFWQAYDKTGSAKADFAFSLHFSPFRDSGFVEAGPKTQGATRPLKINAKDVPAGPPNDPVEYKYTIWAKDACPGGPLDPRFRVSY